PENVFVLNRNTDEIVKLNPKGEFEIRVNQGDKVVVFDANDYFVPNVFNIGSEDENRIRQIELTLKSEELEELVIDSQPTSESIRISGFSYEKPNPDQADIKGIFELIIGLFAKKNPSPEPPRFHQRKV